jgi:hypothetical protein
MWMVWFVFCPYTLNQIGLIKSGVGGRGVGGGGKGGVWASCGGHAWVDGGAAGFVGDCMLAEDGIRRRGEGHAAREWASLRGDGHACG